MRIDTEFNSAAQVPSKLCVDAAVLAEEQGFGCVWKGESNSRDPLVLLSAMAARTSRIDLGTAIYHTYGRSPVTLGMQAASFNELADGRLILGLGVANPVIAAWHGEEFERPLRRMREYVELVRSVYAGERVAYEGDFFASSRGFKLAFDPPAHPLRIWIAGLGPQMAALAGKLGDGVIINIANERIIPEIMNQGREGARAAGRDPDRFEGVAKIRVALHPDVATARWTLKKVLTFYTLQRGYSDVLVRMGWGEVVSTVQETYRTDGFSAARKQIPDEMLEDAPMFAGSTLDGLGKKLDAFEAAGATRCVVAYVPAGDDQRAEIEGFLDQMRPVTAERDGA